MDVLTREESFRLLEEAPVAHVGLISNGDPYVTPMSFVLEGERILFRTKPGKKLDAIRSHPRVCLEVSRFDDHTGDWASVIVVGTAAEKDDELARQSVLERLFDKYSEVLSNPLSRGGLQPLPGLPHVIEITIEEITGMSSGGGLSFRTRPGRL